MSSLSGARVADGDWLDLVADLLNGPLTRWPEEQVVNQLRRTFDLVTCSYSDGGPGRPRVHRIWPLEDPLDGHRREIEQWAAARAACEHPLLRFYLATGERVPMQTVDVPGCFLTGQSRAAWEEVSRLTGSRYQLSLPIRLAGESRRALVLGRGRPFSAAELQQATRIWRLLTGLDRQLTALRSTLPVTPEPATQDLLTPRELAVLHLLSAGLTSSAIAHRLCIGERTVHKHLGHLYAKLGVGDRLTAVLRGQQLGLLAVQVPLS